MEFRISDLLYTVSNNCVTDNQIDFVKLEIYCAPDRGQSQ